MVTASAAVYAVVAPKSWQSSQAMIVRNVAVGNDSDANRFNPADELKSIQETVLKLSRAKRAARRAGNRGTAAETPSPAVWPSEADVEDLQKSVKIVPPKGVEFGASEVFYLQVRDKDRHRALALSTALAGQLQLHLQELRDAKAHSMTSELEKAVQVAKADLKTATARLTNFEKEVGSDLPELRSLLDANISDTSLRRTLTELENELRQCRTAEETNQELLKLLKQAQNDPARLMAAPNRLLESQPALHRLKDGLVDAQLRTAALEGRMSADHPEVIAAREAESQVADRLHAELEGAIRGVESDLSVAQSRVEFLTKQREKATTCLDHLAGLRASYTNLLSESTNRARQLERAEQSLANARSAAASAKAASLINPVDGPDTGTRPASPAPWLVVVCGMLGGLVAGAGVVLLTAPSAAITEFAERSVATRTTGTVVVPYHTREYVPQVRTNSTESWSMTVGTQDNLTCSQALKVLSDRGRPGNTPL